MRELLRLFDGLPRALVNSHSPEITGSIADSSFLLHRKDRSSIHRHSESPVAKIRISRCDGQVSLEVEDEGKGIPHEKRGAMDSVGTPGVGIRGMRERLRQLGGNLEIKSNGSGTVVVARLPVVRNSLVVA